jgi:SWI/SNF-related matrix-associated actin-dependent regulator of chromatin subfamily A member 5
MAWLARQAEVFAFFTADNKAKDGAASKRGGKKKAKKAGRGGAKRMAEADEDEQMVANAMNEKQPRATRLTVQPTCIKFGTMRAYQVCY